MGLGAAGGNNLVDGEHQEQRMFEFKGTLVMWGLGDLSCGWNMPAGGWLLVTGEPTQYRPQSHLNWCVRFHELSEKQICGSNGYNRQVTSCLPKNAFSSPGFQHPLDQ